MDSYLSLLTWFICYIRPFSLYSNYWVSPNFRVSFSCSNNSISFMYFLINNYCSSTKFNKFCFSFYTSSIFYSMFFYSRVKAWIEFFKFVIYAYLSFSEFVDLKLFLERLNEEDLLCSVFILADDIELHSYWYYLSFSPIFISRELTKLFKCIKSFS